MTFPWLTSKTVRLVSFLLFLSACMLAAYLVIESNPYRLKIVADAGECAHPCSWNVTGRINSSDAASLNLSKVWVEAKTSRGDRRLYFSDVRNGEFTIKDVSDAIQNRRVTGLTAHVSYKGTHAQTKFLDESLGGVQLGLSVVAFVFLTSLILPFVKREPGRLLYLFCLVFAGCFAVIMIVGIAWGMRNVNATDPGEIIPLAFGSVAKGSYSVGTPPEWLFTFTSPVDANGNATAAAAGLPAIQKGFGAPLWVLLLSVVGCAILTVQLIVGEIKTPPEENTVQIRDRIQKVVRHQFFILFSPIGAVFVYQMVVIAGAADNDLTVALAALGSGVALNSLLNVAMRHARNLIEGARPSERLSGREGMVVAPGAVSRSATM